MVIRTWSPRTHTSNVIMTITWVVVGIIVLGIVFVLAGANRNNGIVDFVLDIGNWLTGPFHNLFNRTNGKENVGYNWGLAAIVYLFLGGLVARMVRD